MSAGLPRPHGGQAPLQRHGNDAIGVFFGPRTACAAASPN